MKTLRPRSRRLTQTLAVLGALTTAAPFTSAAFTPTGAGPYDYNNTANWGSGTINNQFSTNPAAHQTIFFAADTTLTSTLSITNTGTFNHTFIGSGDRTITLGGSLAFFGTGSNLNSVTIGSTNAGEKLNISLGGTARKFEPAANRTLDILNVISGTGTEGISKEGAGTLRLSNTANTFTGGVSFLNAGGVLEVTKLANGGEDSSIGKSDNQATRLSFGGSATGTLRYIGAGDSTDRRFNIGGVGAIFDASGTGAINWTNTSAPSYSSTGQARTITFKGTNTGTNTMSASFADSGAGKTAFTKDGAGTWVLSGNNTATGDITVMAGKLAIGSSNRLGDTARLVMNGGTFSTEGFAETLGTLQLTGNSTIDLGNNATGSALVFASSALEIWSASVSLNIINFTDGTDSVFFGAGGLSPDQIAQIRINGTHYALLDGSGYLILGAAIPEPSTYALLAGLGGLLLTVSRRQRRAA